MRGWHVATIALALAATIALVVVLDGGRDRSPAAADALPDLDLGDLDDAGAADAGAPEAPPARTVPDAPDPGELTALPGPSDDSSTPLAAPGGAAVELLGIRHDLEPGSDGLEIALDWKAGPGHGRDAVVFLYFRDAAGRPVRPWFTSEDLRDPAGNLAVVASTEEIGPAGAELTVVTNVLYYSFDRDPMEGLRRIAGGSVFAELVVDGRVVVRSAELPIPR